MTPPDPRPIATALREIRAVEATRMLGLLEVSALPPLARQWLRDGIDAPSARTLAALELPLRREETVARTPAVLLATLAVESGVHIATLEDARAVHAQSVIGLMATGVEFSTAVFQFSNNFTDHLTGRLKRLLQRPFRDHGH